MSRKDLERTQVSIEKLKNPQPEFGVVREKQQFMPKMESKPIADMSSANTMGTSSIKKVPMREKTQPELAKDYEMAKRPRPNTPNTCLLYTSPSPRDRQKSRMPSSA